MKKKSFSSAVILAALTCYGCAAPRPQTPKFSAPIENAYVETIVPGLQWQEKPGVNWKRYKRISVEPPWASISQNGSYRHIDPEALQVLADAFLAETEAVLGEDYLLTREIEPDVLTIRLAATDLFAPTREINTTSRAAGFIPIGLRGAALEAEIADGLSGEVLAVMRDARIGEAGSLEFYRGFTSLQYLRRAFSTWAAELRALLDERLPQKKRKKDEAKSEATPAGEAETPVPSQAPSPASIPAPQAALPDAIVPPAIIPALPSGIK